jgi:hypothetical protein
MAASKLRIYNQALGHLGERSLASLSEPREPRRVLDDYYSDVVAHCLEMGNWKFALRDAAIDAHASVTPAFGFAKAFRKPIDCVRTCQVSANETFEPPLLRFTAESLGTMGVFWYADCDPLYVRYVSNHAAFGGLDLSRWTQLFEDYVALRLALLACPRISGAESRAESLRRQERKALAAAREHDAANSPPQFQPGGTWAMSRGAGNASRWNRRSF